MVRPITQIVGGLALAAMGLLPIAGDAAPANVCLAQIEGGSDSSGVMRECDQYPGTCTTHYNAVSICGDVWYECDLDSCGTGSKVPCGAPGEQCTNDNFKSCLDPDTTECNIAAVTHDCGTVRRGECTVIAYNGPGDTDCPGGTNFKCTTTSCGSLGGNIDCEDISACSH